MQELSKQYRPAEHEERIFARWTEAGAFHADPGRVLRGEAEPYCILIPPPNVTDRLHLGHALNNSLQDILARAHRMMGYETLWMPGTDHAGIATQAVVERRLKKDGKLKGPLRTSMQRDEFVAHVQAFKDEYEAVITGQLKRMGCSCDFERQRFTMDSVCARAVREAFFRLFKDGLIYRGKRLVNWDPALQTAVADDEVENIEIDGAFYYLRYPLVHSHSIRAMLSDAEADSLSRVDLLMKMEEVFKLEIPEADAAKINTVDEGIEYLTKRIGDRIDDAIPVTWSELARKGYSGADKMPPDEQAYVTVATTRPETYLGDTAVAVNPHDPRAKALRGMWVELPLVGRVIPIIEDSYVVLPSREGKYGKAIGLGTPSLADGGEESQSSSPVSERRDTQEPEDAKAAFATGFLKVTPAHDPNDYELGVRHKLATINVMAPDASISDKHGWSDVGDAHIFVGKKREDARKLVVKEFEARGLLEDQKPYRHTVGHSDRSKAAIEPYLSDQWYVRVTDPRMAASANAALDPAQRSSSLGGPPLRAGPELTSLSIIDDRPILPMTPEGFIPRNPYPKGQPSPKDLIATRHFLPHLQLPNATYFVTWRTDARAKLSAEERTLAMNAIRHFDGSRVHLYAATVMPDHVHCVVRCPDGTDMTDWCASVKRFSATKINADRGSHGAIWQPECFDHIVRDGTYLAEFIEYVVFNPVEEGLAEKPSEYAWTFVSDSVLAAIGSKRPGSERRATKEGTTEDGDGSLSFHPARYAKTYEGWHDNIRDWCISRQLWWGHRIPVWSKRDPLGAASTFAKLLEGAGASSGFVHVTSDWSALGCAHFIRRIDTDHVESSVCVPLEPAKEIAGRKFPAPGTGVVSSEEVIRRLEAGGFTQDPDVLDTWFSSALWPMSTMGWPDAELAAKETGIADFPSLLPAFNPTSTLCTAREIITLWVSRMVMFNRYFLGEGLSAQDSGLSGSAQSSALSPQHSSPGPIPFHDVFIHCVVQDGEGRKMSKSLGNGVDPLDIIASHGADAMRFTVCNMSTNTQDVRLPVKKDSVTGKNTSDKFDLGRNFANKLWNAASFALKAVGSGQWAMGKDKESPPAAPLPIAHSPLPPSLPDRWMLSRLATAVGEVESALKNFEFSSYAQTMYDLLWRDFCDWYLEAIKPTVAQDASQRAVLAGTLDTILRLLHPIMPYVTEAIYEQVRELEVGMPAGVTLGAARKGGLLATAPWPKVDSSLRDEKAEAEFEQLRAVITAIREVRAKHNVQPKRRPTLHAPTAKLKQFKANETLVATLAGLGAMIDSPPDSGTPFVDFTSDGAEYKLSDMADAVDAGAEKARLTKLVADLEKSVSTFEARLANPGYAAKAPPAMVQQTKDQMEKAKAELVAARKALEGIA